MSKPHAVVESLEGRSLLSASMPMLTYAHVWPTTSSGTEVGTHNKEGGAVAAANKLGTVNHTLLTLSALELGGILAAGVVLSATENPDPSFDSNRDAIIRLSGLDRVLDAPWTSDPEEAARALEPAIPWVLPPR